MKATAPMTKIELIESSLRCFDYGLIGLLPVIGIPMAFLSAAQYRRVKRGQGDTWNPAHRYWYWGGVCARMGLALFLIIPLALFIIVAYGNYL
jgi:hypothetical protein